MKRKIAYIDDSDLNLEAWAEFLRNDFEVDCFQRAKNFLKNYPQRQYEAILVDLHMPEMNGFEVYEALVQHPQYNGCPILIVSSDTSEESRVKSFELGAVDFIDRTLSVEQIIARVNAKIQFFKKHRSIIEFENLKIDLTKLKVFISGNEVQMTFIEIKFLTHILRYYPEALPKERVIEYIWDNTVVMDNTIYTHIFNLNSKFDKWPYEIRIIKGQNLIELVERKES